VATPILRVLLNPGHGLGNSKAGSYDPGAISPYGEEATLVADIADAVASQYFRTSDASVSVIETPKCSPACVEKHPFKIIRGQRVPYSHLAQTIRWVNENAAPFDLLLSLHMNSSYDPKATGTEVFHASPATAEYARVCSKVLSESLMLPDRGPKLPKESHSGSIAILSQTEPRALLAELGFVSNLRDVFAVRTRSVQAVTNAIEALAKVRV
jgi:N-acetylmuramoyl-L-alanine amidase